MTRVIEWVKREPVFAAPIAGAFILLVVVIINLTFGDSKEESDFRNAISTKFDELPTHEQQSVCAGVDFLGMDTAIAIVADSYGSDWQEGFDSIVEDILLDRCK